MYLIVLMRNCRLTRYGELRKDINDGKSVKRLRIIRRVCAVPYVIVIVLALVNSLIGVDAFINSSYLGIDAFLLMLIAYAVSYWWIGIFCLIMIIVISIMIYCANKKA